ncbi:MCE family protein [Mycolicibacterium sp.]|uniref:MCE family protein n=1 Tax=Mycolicibacterium sp. TaxID=2320850 RepID=UPI003D14830C
MTTSRPFTFGVATTLVLLLVAGVAVVAGGSWNSVGKTRIVAYFDNSDGLFAGDEVRILGVAVGEVESIEPQPERAKVTFWVKDKYPIPVDARAVILTPQLVTARAIALTPAYTGGPAMPDGAVIAKDRTAVPVEWDDLRSQLERLAKALQPTEPGGVSSLGALIATAADNLRGRGPTIRDTLIAMSQAFSALGDHSGDLFATVKNLSVLVSALQSSSDLMAQLNVNLAAVTALLADDPDEIGRAVADLNTAVADVQAFVADNRDAITTTTDRLAAVTDTVVDSMGEVEQLLHSGPTVMANLANVYQPAQSALSGALMINNFANPIDFICGAVQAASRLGADESAKLCVQYLAPIVKNRQYNFPPLGENLFVGASARPNELTFSEDWMRPAFATTDPGAGLPGMMVPNGDGS